MLGLVDAEKMAVECNMLGSETHLRAHRDILFFAFLVLTLDASVGFFNAEMLSGRVPCRTRRYQYGSFFVNCLLLLIWPLFEFDSQIKPAKTKFYPRLNLSVNYFQVVVSDVAAIRIETHTTQPGQIRILCIP
jgi:hypothetical protein